MSEVIALFGTDYFLVAVRFGLAAVGIGWALRLLLSREGRPLPIVGLLVAVGTVATIGIVEGSLDSAMIPALLLIAAGVSIARLAGAHPVVEALGAVPGAAWLAITSDVPGFFWVRLMFLVMIPLAGYLVNDFELRHEGMGLGVVYFALAALGVFGAIPDTEWAVALIGLTLPIVFLAWPKVAASMGSVGSYLAVAVLFWITGHGGDPRPASIVGSAACLGLLLLEPVVIAIRPSAVRVSRSVRRDWLGSVIASVPQFMVVLICSRVAARFTNPLPALAVVAFIFGAVLVVGLQAGSPEPGAEGY